MSSLPLVLNGARCSFVVIGGGEVATRKVKTLVRSGASVRVIAPVVSEEIQALADAKSITLELKAAGDEAYQASDYVVLATDSKQVNQAQADLARKAGASVCRTDEPEDNDFSFPAVIDRSPLKIAVSTLSLIHI